MSDPSAQPQIVSDPRSQTRAPETIETHQRTIRLAAWVFMAGYVAGESQPILRGLHDPSFLTGFAIFSAVLALIAWCMVRFSSRIAAILLLVRATDFLFEIIGLIAGRIHDHTLGEAWIMDAVLLLLGVGVMLTMVSATLAAVAVQKMRKSELLSVFE